MGLFITFLFVSFYLSQFTPRLKTVKSDNNFTLDKKYLADTYTETDFIVEPTIFFGWKPGMYCCSIKRKDIIWILQYNQRARGYHQRR